MYYLRKLISSNFYIAYDIITPTPRMNPQFVEVPLYITRDVEILLFFNLVSMTPGTLSINVDNKRQALLVHSMYTKDIDIVLKELHNIQQRVKRVFA